MAGGPATPSLVTAATHVGSLGFLAGGYKTPDALAAEIAAVRPARAFGVNLFAPNPVPVDWAAYRRYAELIQADADKYGLDLESSAPREDDDHWRDKLELLLADPVPLVSFTFGIPDPSVLAAFRQAGTLTVQTVTSVDEAKAAAAAGVDALAVQGVEAGGHYGTLTPDVIPPAMPLVELVRRVGAAVSLPLAAAGGLARPEDVAAVMDAGAGAVMVGTVLLRVPESGTNPVYKDAVAARPGAETLVTRSFTGRPARALPNLWTDRYDREAPSGYPAIHYLTSPLRKLAMAAGDADRINLWAGTGHRHATTDPAGEVLTRLASRL
jgi:NAD(P)H-dependent flavin oxidoreductase YrpB (nitropropane dioxygenase family)